MHIMEEKMANVKTWDFLDEFVKELQKDLERGEERWGDTWLNRSREGQEERIEQYIKDHLDRYRYAGQPVRWVSIAGECLIAWIREKHPELFGGE